MGYTYYSVLRPVGPGTYPEPADNEVVMTESFYERMYVPKIGREAWGCIMYDAPLPENLVQQYDLVQPLDDRSFEDKKKICRMLCKVLQQTRGCYDLVSLDYDPGREVVTMRYASGGGRVVNVAMDSGVAMIRDIMRCID